MGKIEDILIDGNQRNASDIHLCPGSPVMFRIDGDLIPMSAVSYTHLTLPTTERV